MFDPGPSGDLEGGASGPLDPVDAAHRSVATLLDEDRSGWGPAARTERVRRLAALKERVEAALVVAVDECDAAEDWSRDGARSAQTWLAGHAPLTRTDAGQVVLDARFRRAHADLAAAVDVGALTASHLRSMRVAARGLDDEFAACKDTLLDHALGQTATEFAETMKQWRELLHHREPDHGDRGFRIRRTLGGWGVPDGLLDPEICALFDRCMADLHPPDADPGPEGPRTANQRGADAFGDLCRRHLGGHTGAAPATTADVVVDLSVLARHRFADVLDPADRWPEPWNRSAIDGRPLSVADAERLLCDSPFGRIVLDEVGEVLDLGRQRRQYSRGQRRGMGARDGGCGWWWCDQPPERCEAHHTRFWERDHGLTDLDLGLLLCRRHHALVHRGGWAITRDPVTGLVTLTTPDGRTHTYDVRTRRRRHPDHPMPADGVPPEQRTPARC